MDAFADILNRPSGEAPKPVPLPAGTYVCLIDGPHKTSKVGQDQTDVAEFTLKVLQVVQANEEEIAAVEGGVLGKTISARFFITEKALYRLDEFLEKLGIAKGLPYKQALAECPGKTVIISVIQKPSPDGTRLFNEIRSYATP